MGTACHAWSPRGSSSLVRMSALESVFLLCLCLMCMSSLLGTECRSLGSSRSPTLSQECLEGRGALAGASLQLGKDSQLATKAELSHCKKSNRRLRRCSWQGKPCSR